jgi:hypothetical protein
MCQRQSSHLFLRKYELNKKQEKIIFKKSKEYWPDLKPVRPALFSYVIADERFSWPSANTGIAIPGFEEKVIMIIHQKDDLIRLKSMIDFVLEQYKTSKDKVEKK